MTYSDIKSFLLYQMRMSHIYQPVMIKCLLEHKGAAEDKEIATALLKHDPTQIEYYQAITNNMVGKVLRNRGIVQKERSIYHLSAYQNLSTEQVEELVLICDQKVQEYKFKRGELLWKHRRKNRGYISGSIKYDVLKRAKDRCELCGISAREKALEVDHIDPVTLGGENSIDNYQALCYSCNSMKGNRDNADFRDIYKMYEHREGACIFCKPDQERVVNDRDNLAYIILDKYPVTDLHCLIVPRRHSSDYFELTQPEINATSRLLHYAKEYLRSRDNQIQGFNIGINCGEAAGQTVLHTHLHLIPRRSNDVANPTGGVRNVIPGKGNYL